MPLGIDVHVDVDAAYVILESIENDVERIERKLKNPHLRTETRAKLARRLAQLLQRQGKLEELLEEFELREMDIDPFLESVYDDDTLGPDGAPLTGEEEVVTEVRIPWL